jgi:hypothetical protein
MRKKTKNKVPKNLWDPLLDALITEIFKFRQSAHYCFSYERKHICTVKATTLWLSW